MPAQNNDAQKHVVTPAISALLEVYAASGGDVLGALQRAGLGHVARPLMAGIPVAVPRMALAQLSAECVWAAHAESCRRLGTKPLPVGRHRLLLRATLGCTTLREALSVLEEFYDLINPEEPIWIVERGDDAMRLVMHRRRTSACDAEFFLSAFGVSTYHRLFSWLIGEELPLIEVTFAFPKRMGDLGLQAFFSSEILFDKTQDSFSFSSRFLDRPIVAKAGEVDELFKLFCYDLLQPQYELTTLGSRVYAAMQSALASGQPPLDMVQLATMFGLSEATLRRRLAAEKISIEAMRMQCRRQLALSLLRKKELSVQEIAARLFYADTATFRRAFKQWEGVSPSDWRAREDVT
jgi:AraC-like DNA-binding protein